MGIDRLGRPYTAGAFTNRYVGDLAGAVALTAVGTAVAVTAIANSQRRVPANTRITFTSVSLYVKTGGTAVGPVLNFQYSLAGTGDWTNIGSYAFGTQADDTTAVVTCDSTIELAAGDLVRWAVGAGTAVSSPVFHAVGEWIEVFEST